MNCDNTFKIGQEFQSIHFPDESCFRVGHNGVEKIALVMECGQYCGVPWFAVWQKGRIVSKHNATHVASVFLKEADNG